MSFASFGSVYALKKRLSFATLIVFVSHIFSPFFAYALSGDPSWTENILKTEAPAIIQLNSVPLPRSLVAWDVVTLGLTGSVIASPSATFMTDEDTTLAHLVDAINAVATGSITASVQTGTGKSIVLNASIPGVIVGTLTIDRDLTQRNIRDAVTAVAQQALISLPQQLFPSDTIHVTLAGSGASGGVGISESFTGNSASTRAALVSQIDALSFVDATLTGSTDIIITSSFSGTPFSLSNVSVISSSLPVTSMIPNVPAQAQKEVYNLSRTTNGDEALAAHIAGFTITGSTLSDLATRIDTNLAGIVHTTLSGANSLEVIASTAGVPFATGSLNITWGTLFVVPLIPNRVAVAQVDELILPRVLVTWDLVRTTISIPSVSLSKNFTGSTLSELSTKISTDPQVGLYVSGAVSSSTLTLTSRIPGTAFTTSSAHIDSTITSVNVNPNIVAQSRVDRINFPRSLVAWDIVSLTINGNTVSTSFSGTSSGTLTNLANSISIATVGVSAISSWLSIVVSSTVPGQDFTLSNISLENSNQATVLVTPVIPVKQKNTYVFHQAELLGDILSVTVNGTPFTGSTLTGVIDAINTAGIGIDASRVGQTMELLAHTGGVSFTASNMISTSLDFTGSTTPGVSEIQATATFSLDTMPTDGESMVIGNCTVSFNTGSLFDTDCSDNVASIDVTGQSSLEFLAAGIRGISHITYADGTSTGVILAPSGTGTGIIFSRNTTQVGTLQIPASISWTFGSALSNTPTSGSAQIDTIVLPRSLVDGDTLALSISGQIVSQNIGTSTGADFDNFINTLNLIENISASRIGDTITLTAKTPGTPFVLNFGRLTNLSESVLSVSNDAGRVEVQNIHFPSYIQNGDSLSFGIDGTTLTGTFNTDVSTTFSSIISTSPIAGIVFAASGAQDLVISSTTPGAFFQVNPLSVNATFTGLTLTGNVVAGYQKDTLTLPFDPVNGDTISVTVSGATESGTFTRPFSGDLPTTMGLLSSDISTLTGTVSASLDATSKIITLDAVKAGNGFDARFNIAGTSIAPTTLTENTGSQAQVDQIVLGRTIASGDVLSLTVNTGSFSIPFAVDSDTTMSTLASSISSSLSWVVSAGYAGGILTLTSLVPGTPFTTSSLSIATTVPSTSIQPNIAPVAQKDFIDFERDSMPGDTFSFSFSGASLHALSGSTLTGLLDTANLTLTGVASFTLSGTHAVEVLSSVAGTPFALSNIARSNTPYASGSYTPNVVSVFPIREIDLPSVTLGDVITVTVDNGTIFSATGSDASGLLSSLNTSWIVSATLSGSTVSLLGLKDIPFLVTQATVVNITTVTLNQAYVAPVSRDVELVPMITAPATTYNAGWTMNVTLNGENFSYLTHSGDTLDTVVNALYNQISLTGSSAGTGITLLPSLSGGILVSTGTSSTGTTIGLPMIHLVSEVAGVGFTESFGVQDITAPILSSSHAQLPQRLRSEQTLTSTWVVQANEPGSLYFVSSSLTVTNASEVLAATASGKAFLAIQNMAGDVVLPSSLTVPSVSLDGRYDLIAVDRANNLSMGMVGWLTVDNTAPVLSITTPDNQVVNQDTFTLSWVTKASVGVDITLGTGMIHLTSLGDGSFSGTLDLPQNTGSTITVVATDSVGNNTTRTLNVTEDSGIPPLSFTASALITNLSSITLSGSTKSGANVLVTGGSGSVNTQANASGSFSLTVPLTLNANNVLVIDVVDQASNTNSGTISILQDSTAPTVSIATLPQTVHAGSITLHWTTENNSTIVVTNGVTLVGTGTSSATGTWNIVSTLTPNTINTLVVTATDVAGNIGTGSVDITEDSTPNTLVISTQSQTINANSLTVTGSTKPNSLIHITGGLTTATGSADGIGIYSVLVNLAQDATNTLLVTSTDVVLNDSTGSIVVVEDSTAPVTVISTQSQTTYNPIITLSGTTEAFANVTVTGGSLPASTVASASGIWTTPVSLNLSSLNTLVVTATDLAGNSGSASVNITHDATPIFLNMNVPNQTVHASNFTFTGATKSGATVMFQVNTGSVTTITAPLSGNFTGTVSLLSDTINTVYVVAQDATLTIATGSFVITEDSTSPVLSFVNPSGATSALTSVLLQGTTEANASLSVNNSGVIVVGNATATGVFALSIPLNANVLNTLNVTATDAVGNIGTGTWTVIQDSLGPVISGLSVSPTVLGPTMAANYTFTTNENSTGTFLIGTGANVALTTVASGSTFGTTHTSLVSGLLANTDYYYIVTTTDSVGNSNSSSVGVINSIDTVPPVIQDVTLSGLGTTTAKLDFTFTESNFNTTYATGSITIKTSTGLTIGVYPTTFSGGVVSAGSSALSGLSAGTEYTYTLSLTDMYGNTSTLTGTFITPTVVPLSGGSVTQTGAVVIGSGALNTALSGTTITVISNPNNIDSLTGSLTISWVTSILSSSGGWNGVLLSPVLVASNLPEAAINADIQALVTALNNSTTLYSIGQIFQTVKVGAEGVSITAVGGNFRVSFVTPAASVGQVLRIYRSSDGNLWQNNAPGVTCTLDAQKMCTFDTDHLSYFAVASIIATPIPATPSYSGGGGGGGGSLAKDNCPDGDYSSSYYDGICGVKPTSTSMTTQTGTGKQNVTFTSDIDTMVTGSKTLSEETFNRFVQDIKYRVYTRSLRNSERIMAFSSMNRYIDRQSELTNNTYKKTVLQALKKRFEDIIVSLKNDISHGITVTPNRKKNNISSDIIPGVQDGARIYRYVNTENILAVRSGPSFQSETTGYLLMNERVELIARGPNWSQIKGNTVEWFVRTRLLRQTREVRNHDASLVYASVSTTERAVASMKEE